MPHDPTDMPGPSEDDWRRSPADDETQEWAPLGDDPPRPRGRHAASRPWDEQEQPRDGERRPEPHPWARNEQVPDSWQRDQPPRDQQPFDQRPTDVWARDQQPRDQQPRDQQPRDQRPPDPWAADPRTDFAAGNQQPFDQQPTDPWERDQRRPDPWAYDPRTDFAATDAWAREPGGDWGHDGDSAGDDHVQHRNRRRSGRGVMVACLALAVVGVLSAATGAGWFYLVQNDGRSTAADLGQSSNSRARGSEVPRDDERASRHVRPSPTTPSPTRTSASPKATPTRTSPAPSPTRAERKPEPAETATKPKPKPRRTTPPPAPEPEPTQASQATEYENEVVRLTNAERADAGCGALRTDERLRTAARRHSTDMDQRNYFDHNSPDGTTPWDRMRQAGYDSPGAENIARGYPSPQAVVEGWMNSEGHRKNMLNCSLHAIGVGVHIADGGPWWTQDFGYE